MKFKDLNNKITSINDEENIDVGNQELTSLEGSPEIVGNDFNCNNNKLTSLEYSPSIIQGSFFCSHNNLKTLKSNIKSIGVDFYCKLNDLESLEHCPKTINRNFNCCNNKKLKNVKQQIIQYQIKAIKYYTDDGIFSFEDIKKEFLEYGKQLQIKNKIKENIKLNKKILNKNDYGLSL